MSGARELKVMRWSWCGVFACGNSPTEQQQLHIISKEFLWMEKTGISDWIGPSAVAMC
jgi:hypothetical protein